MKLETPFGNFFRALPLKLRYDLSEDEWEYTEEPHVSRRKEILAKHPEVKQLMGSDPLIAAIVSLEVIIQLAVAYGISVFQPNILVWLLLTYFIGATLNHSLAAAIHEIGHNLAFGHKHGTANRVLSIIANLPMVVPVAISYRKYHHEHHRWLGHEELDVDIPLRSEVYFFTTSFTRFIWVSINSFFYAFRPFLKSPQPISVWEVVNIVIQGAFDYLAWRFLGWYGFNFLLIGTVLGFGPHPMAGHVISEHYLFADNLATHSYYGVLNLLLFNVGYHVEHHDFPYIPYTRLHKLREMAPEFYKHLPYHSSLCKVMWDFVFMPNLGPQARSITSTLHSKQEVYKDMVHFELARSLTYPTEDEKEK